MDTATVTLIAEIDRLPVSIPVAREVIRLCGGELLTPLQLRSVILLDPALLAHQLRVANAAYFTRPAGIVHLEDVQTVLGITLMRDLALGQALFSLTRSEPEDRVLWQQSLLNALVARAMAEVYDPEHEQLYYAASLLQYIGSLGMNYLQAGDRSLPDAAGSPGKKIRLFDFDQADFGAILLKKWNLPTLLVDLVQSGSHPEVFEGHSETFRQVRFVSLSRLLTRRLWQGSDKLKSAGWTDNGSSDTTLLSEAELEELLSSVKQRVETYIQALQSMGIRVGENGL